jgi:hypothetical protein
VIEKAREDYIIQKAAKKKKSLIELGTQTLTRTLNLRTSQVQRNMFGGEVTRKDGSLVRKENANLLRIKTDVAKFALERLDPENFGKVDKTENKHLVFSLADLRRAKQKQSEEAQSNHST